MKGKIIFIFSIIFILLAISATSANDNVTVEDILTEDSSDNIVLEESHDSDILNNDSGSEADVDENSSDDSNSSEDTTAVSSISASDKVSYKDFKDTFTISLKSNGTALVGKSVKIVLNNVAYNKVTDKNGEATINFKLKTGTYNIQFFFEGDDNYTASNGTAKLTIKSNLVTYLKVVDKKVTYRQGSKSIFQVKLVDIYGNPVKGKTVKIKVNGKTYKVKTNSKGYATKYLKLKKGTYKIKFSFSASGKYLASSGSYKIKVKPEIEKGNGYWVNKWDMKKVNLKKLAKKGTKHIFLLHTVFSKYGVSKVHKWINKAHKYGIKVHIWMSVFYKNGKFIHAASKSGKYNYKHMKKMIKQAKHYASYKYVDGIHFDYLRYGGNAYKYKNSVKAVNYFVKKASQTVRSAHPNIIVSAAVMPEPSSMKHYYAQDIPTISKYLDVVVPMVYKGNYHASSKWIKKITKKFVKKSNGAKIWTGLQSYKSDSNIKKLSYKALFKDAKNAKKGGASGVVLFRWGLSALLNFKKL